jgi:hypothetical protein
MGAKIESTLFEVLPRASLLPLGIDEEDLAPERKPSWPGLVGKNADLAAFDLAIITV